MVTATILVVEDETDILEVLTYNLKAQGYGVISAQSGDEALEIARRYLPDLILLDLMLPGIDGLEVCRRLRADPETAHIPVIMVTAKDSDVDVVTGLEVGADDYVTKPFSYKVLLARIRSAVRRSERPTADSNETISIRGLLIHPGRHEVRIQGRPVRLTYTEFKILHLLASRPGRAFTRYQIVDAVRGPHSDVTDRSVDFHIVGLRRKLGAYGRFIETVRNIGYRFRD